MNKIMDSTFKSAFISVGLHVLVVVLGSLAIYGRPMTSLELTGASGRGNSISLSGFNFGGNPSIKKASGIQTKPSKNIISSSSELSSAALAKEEGNEGAVVGSGVNSGTGNGGSGGSGSFGGGAADFDHGQLFGQIKTFFETRLGQTLNIRETQLIKIKLLLTTEGEISNVSITEGKLDFLTSKKILSVARSIPLKALWKSGSAYPQELIIPLILTPS